VKRKLAFVLSMPLFVILICFDIIKAPLVIVFFCPLFGYFALIDWLRDDYERGFFTEAIETMLFLGYLIWADAMGVE
jgi:hypothetical protein